MRPSPAEVVRWSEALAGIARTGLGFTESLYERERFGEVLKVAAEMQAVAGLVDDAEATEADWLDLVAPGVAGYATPKVAVGAVVGNDQHEILLVQRADSGIWLYPTGWADIGYSAAEVVLKEVAEETGIDVEVVAPIAILDGLQMGFTRIPMYSLVFHCRAVGGTLLPHPLECADVGWFAEDNLPAPLAGATKWKAHAFAAIRGEPVPVLWDRPRQPIWRTSQADSPQPAGMRDSNEN